MENKLTMNNTEIGRFYDRTNEIILGDTTS